MHTNTNTTPNNNSNDLTKLALVNKVIIRKLTISKANIKLP